MSQKVIKMGLGEAVLRLLAIESRARGGAASPTELAERSLLVKTLDELKIDVGFDCNQDNTPDTLEILKATAETSCCRILPSEPEDLPKRSRKVQQSTSRKRWWEFTK